MKKLVAVCAFLLAACGSGSPGAFVGADPDGGARDGGGGVSVQGLTVFSNERDIGILIDVIDDESGVWKVYSEEYDVVFRLNPSTGIVGSAFDAVYYESPDCTGAAIIRTGGGCLGSDLEADVHRLLAVVGGDRFAHREGSNAVVASGALAIRRPRSVFQLTSAGRRCIEAGGEICGVSASPLAGLPLKVATPLTLR